MIHYILKIVLNYKIVICLSILYIIDEHTTLYGINLSPINETLTITEKVLTLIHMIHLFNRTELFNCIY